MNIFSKRRWNIIDVFFIVVAMTVAQHSYPWAVAVVVVGLVVSVAAETKYGKN